MPTWCRHPWCAHWACIGHTVGICFKTYARYMPSICLISGHMRGICSIYASPFPFPVLGICLGHVTCIRHMPRILGICLAYAHFFCSFLHFQKKYIFSYFFPGFPKMAHKPPPPGVERVGTRGCLHPKWQQLACRHSGLREDLHTFINCWAYWTSVKIGI